MSHYTKYLFFFLLLIPSLSYAETADHLVISEVAAGIGSANNEFVEIYNPTADEINIKESGIKLNIANSSGKITSKNITAWNNTTIKPHGFFLFGAGNVNISFDATYSSGSITGIGGIVITDKDNIVIDKVAWGEKPPHVKLPPVSASEFQGFEIDQPGGMDTDKSIERKAGKNSTLESMVSGEDVALGNGWDSDNNNEDFILRSVVYPQNSLSLREPEPEEEQPGPPDDPAPLPPPAPENKDEEPKQKIYPHEIRLSELLPDPKGSDETLEFIELENYGERETDLTNWSIQDAKENENQQETVHTFTLTPSYCAARSDACKIPAGEFFVMYSRDYSVKNLTLNNTQGDTVRLLNPQNTIINTVSYAEKKVKEDHSYALNNAEWQWTSILTPGKKNQFPAISENKVSPEPTIQISYSSNIHFNEILPNASEEYIELYNNNNKALDLSGWILRDASKTGKYMLPKNTIIASRGFLVITKKEFKFALNNSGEESVFLYNPRAELVSSVSYKGSKKDVSYNFDGSFWRWSRFLTPGAENKFPAPLRVKIKKPERVYRNIPASFEADTSKEAKITWNFGDGHKSYQFSARHTYTNTGAYEASVKVSTAEDFLEKFLVTVEDFPEIKVKISAFSPNPKGNDTELEWIEIENNSKQKVNLKNWSVATGWDKLINHPIKKDFVIKQGESKKLTRKFANFTLQNKKSKIELRYPSGETAHSVKYKSADTIADDMVYQKGRKKWKWIAAAGASKDKKNKNAPAEKDTTLASETAPSENIPPASTTQTVLSPDENISAEASATNLNSAALRESFGYSESPEWKEKKERTAALLDGMGIWQYVPAKKQTELINKLLSIKTIYAQDEIYVFTSSAPEEHYAVKFVKESGRDINYWLAKIVRKLF